jgi:hypothetical protein
MAENTLMDQRVAVVKQRLRQDLVGELGHPVKPDDVSTVVDAKAEEFADAPVQEFVPLLIEHQARDELRQRGLHRDLGDDSSHGLEEPVDGQPAGQATEGPPTD